MLPAGDVPDAPNPQRGEGELHVDVDRGCQPYPRQRRERFAGPPSEVQVPGRPAQPLGDVQILENRHGVSSLTLSGEECPELPDATSRPVT
jgi:hypothetical protein